MHDLVEAADEWLAGAGPVHVDTGVAWRLGVHKDGAMVVLLEFEFDIIGTLIHDVGFKNGHDPLGRNLLGIGVQTGLQEIVVRHSLNIRKVHRLGDVEVNCQPILQTNHP